MTRRQSGFTIVELLVAMALIVFLMSILAAAFYAASGSFSQLKAAGDMAEKLRSATSILRADLAADHFQGRKRLGDPNFWDSGPPAEGCFRLYHGSPLVTEGTDSDGVPLPRTPDHALQFTVKLRGNQRDNYMAAGVPAGSPLLNLPNPSGRYQDSPNVFTSQWALVTWFLKPAVNPVTGQQDQATFQDGSNPVPLWTLYRVQQVCVQDNSQVNPAVTVGNPPPLYHADYLGVSHRVVGQNVYFNSPADLTFPLRRYGMSPANTAGVPLAAYSPSGYPAMSDLNAGLATSDLVLTDVISFTVRVLIDGNPTADWVDLFDPSVQAYAMGNPQFSPAQIPPTPPQTQPQWRPQVFDTWTNKTDEAEGHDYVGWNGRGAATSIPLYQRADGALIRIKALQITLRIWDVKSNQTRQKTMVVDM